MLNPAPPLPAARTSVNTALMSGVCARCSRCVTRRIWQKNGCVRNSSSSDSHRQLTLPCIYARTEWIGELLKSIFYTLSAEQSKLLPVFNQRWLFRYRLVFWTANANVYMPCICSVMVIAQRYAGYLYLKRLIANAIEHVLHWTCLWTVFAQAQCCEQWHV